MGGLMLNGFFKIYSKFLKCLKAGFFQQKLGRRDWTRTNDPHHVKVVL